MVSADLSTVAYDKKEQAEQIIPWLVGSEKLHAVFDCKGSGTGFIAITDKRLMYYNKAFLAKRKALSSVPFNKITEVATIDEGRGAFGIGTSSEIVVKTGGGEYVSFEFRGGDKAQRAYMLIMTEVLQNEPS